MVHSLMVFKGFKGQLNLWSRSTSSYFGNPQKSLLGNRPACNAKIVVILGGIRTTQTRYWGSLCPQTRPTLRSLCCKKHMNEAKGLKFLLSYEFHETYRVPEEQACQTMQTLLTFSHLKILTLFPVSCLCSLSFTGLLWCTEWPFHPAIHSFMKNTSRKYEISNFGCLLTQQKGNW